MSTSLQREEDPSQKDLLLHQHRPAKPSTWDPETMNPKPLNSTELASTTSSASESELRGSGLITGHSWLPLKPMKPHIRPCSTLPNLTPNHKKTSENPLNSYGSFRKLGGPYFGVLIIRILLFRVLYSGPLFSETPICWTPRPPSPHAPTS